MEASAVEDKIRQYLPDIIHLSLATCHNSWPWVSEIHYAYDDDLNLFFRSFSFRRHSNEIAQNSNVAGSIVTQHTTQQKLRGVFFEGYAQLLSEVAEIQAAAGLLSARLELDENAIIEEAKPQSGAKFYKIMIRKFYLFDSREITPGQKYELDWRSPNQQ